MNSTGQLPPGRRVGIFGGSFDPVHNAHLALAEAALQDLHLDQVRWIPAGLAWQKSRQLSAAEHRAAMVQLAIADQHRFVLDRCELDRSGPSFTLDTVRALVSAEPETEWTLIIGQDQYAGLHTWQGWAELLDLVVLAVANRPGDKQHADPAVQRHPHRVVPLPMLDLSSTEVRQRVAAGQSLAALVPPAVARYIDTHGLYRAANRS